MKIAINGFGRIGRAFVRAVLEQNADFEIVAVNDLGDAKNLAYLLKYDSVYGRVNFDVSEKDGEIFAEKHKMSVFAEKDPVKLPWGKLNIDVVVECTGLFTDYSKAKMHIDAGAKRVVISAPAKGTPEESGVSGAMILMSINEEKFKNVVVSSNASCTTNACAPVIAILDEKIGIEKAILNTTHAYTGTQAIVDGPSKKGKREGRAAAINMIPSSTGAAKSVGEVYAPIKNKFDGVSVRVPVPAGSIADITFISKRPTTVEEVNAVLREAGKSQRWAKIFSANDEDLVSKDIVGDPHASIADLTMTRVVDGNLVKVLAWYDNEMGYAHSLVRHTLAVLKFLK